jgi:predicted transcriptional regulator
MNKPDATQHNPDPAHLRELLARAGVSQRKAAELLGMSAAGLQNYIRDPADPKYRKAPYVVQFALEALAE